MNYDSTCSDYVYCIIYNIFILLFILTVDFEHKTEGNLWISDWNDDNVRPVPAIVYRNYIKIKHVTPDCYYPSIYIYIKSIYILYSAVIQDQGTPTSPTVSHSFSRERLKGVVSSSYGSDQAAKNPDTLLEEVAVSHTFVHCMQEM